MVFTETDPIILVAEDDPDDQLLVRDAMRDINQPANLVFVDNGFDLMAYLRRQGRYKNRTISPRPRLVLLDLNMPIKDGRQALKEIKSDPDLRRIPVVVFTTSSAAEDILRSYDLGSNSYIVKPGTYAEIVDVFRVLCRYWLDVSRLPSG